MPTVRGTLALPPGTPETAATVRISVEDVTRADASATVVGEQVLREVSLRDLRFEVSVSDVDPAARYTVRVRAELADGGVLLTTQSVPVLTRGAPDAAIAPVTRVS
jgi:uncharacterized lipoprotein YbaY